jgi:uroporphyrin-III C-methyltransferase/precorrin-2 dehydrogenase/sirohydrochlorin ferrochelatase
MPPDMPAAVIQQATLPQQRVVTATLADLPRRVEEAGLRPPTLVIVGDVVKLRDKLAWYDPVEATGASAVPATAQSLGPAHS